jgi:phosphoribosylglycinamide formyltransferase-1
MLNLVDACEKKILSSQIKVIISDNKLSKGINLIKHKYKAVVVDKDGLSKKDFENKIKLILEKENIDLVCLAGFMTILSKDFLLNWENKVLNIHPSLLPSFRGKNAVDQALRKGVKFTGCTVHIVDSGIDTGTILDQEIVKVSKNDSTESLKKKILKKEHYLYIKVIKKLEKYFENVKDR